MARTTNVPRLAVLWCPHWPVVVAGCRADEPVAVLHANRVVAHSRAAAQEGVAVGMRRRDTQARCPHIRLVPAEPERDARAFDAVVQAVAADVPRLELTEPGTLTFLARGPARYFGGEVAMASRMAALAGAAAGESLAAVSAAGVFGAGVADGRFAAALAARQSAADGAPVVVPAGRAATQAYLAPVPVRTLAEVGGAPADFVHLLQRLGLHHLGAVAALPRVDLAARFGPLGEFAHRVASGADGRLPGVVEPPAGAQVQRVFDEPVHHSDVLVFVARQLAEELAGALGAAGQVCTRLVVVAETEHGERSERVWCRSTGMGAPAMVERVRWQLDGWARDHTLTAGVVLLRLEPDEVRADQGVQQGLWGGRTQGHEWAARAVARLATLAGEQQVLVPAVQGGRHPHEAYRWVPALTADLAEPGDRLGAPQGPWPGSVPSPSPAVVHAQPVQVHLVDAAGRAVGVSGRGAISAAPATLLDSQGEQRVSAWAGPWPVEERWWDTARARRMARLQVLTDAGRLVLLALEGGQWWLTADYA